MRQQPKGLFLNGTESNQEGMNCATTNLAFMDILPHEFPLLPSARKRNPLCQWRNECNAKKCPEIFSIRLALVADRHAGIGARRV
jgi:hypothetical protein